MDELDLFNAIQGEDDSRTILLRLKHYLDEGKDLQWFQAVIPGLLPGTDESKPWLEEARSFLWTQRQYDEHEKKLERKKKLQQPSPLPLAFDQYRLRKHWPVYVEALRPMTKNLLEAANNVYSVVARAECLTEDRNSAGRAGSIDHKHHAFVCVATALQYKVLDPIIADIERQQRKLSREIEGLVPLMSKLGKQLHHVDVNAENLPTAEVRRQALKRQQHQLNEEKMENKELKKALVDFRTLLVAEKVALDKLPEEKKGKKRGAMFESSESSEVRPDKRVKI
ncbi:hypothetical protein ACN47E_009380 [Coniothyrium glycines]